LFEDVEQGLLAADQTALSALGHHENPVNVSGAGDTVFATLKHTRGRHRSKKRVLAQRGGLLAVARKSCGFRAELQDAVCRR
jgi:sugar/nucleoside kinase (ribokinase family)